MLFFPLSSPFSSASATVAAVAAAIVVVVVVVATAAMVAVADSVPPTSFPPLFPLSSTIPVVDAPSFATNAPGPGLATAPGLGLVGVEILVGVAVSLAMPVVHSHGCTGINEYSGEHLTAAARVAFASRSFLARSERRSRASRQPSPHGPTIRGGGRVFRWCVEGVLRGCVDRRYPPLTFVLCLLYDSHGIIHKPLSQPHFFAHVIIIVAIVTTIVIVVVVVVVVVVAAGGGGGGGGVIERSCDSTRFIVFSNDGEADVVVVIFAASSAIIIVVIVRGDGGVLMVALVAAVTFCWHELSFGAYN